MTEVHWHIIANLGFKFRSHFTAHCGRHAACMRIICFESVIQTQLSQSVEQLSRMAVRLVMFLDSLLHCQPVIQSMQCAGDCSIGGGSV